MGDLPEPRQTFDVWLMGFLRLEPSSSIDRALQAYIEEHSLVVRHSLDEPPQITNVRTRLAILEASGMVDRANSRDEGLMGYADLLRSLLDNYSQISPEARAALATRACTTGKDLRGKR
jgi:hypothetical protein